MTVIETAWQVAPRLWGSVPRVSPRVRHRLAIAAVRARFLLRRYGPAEVGGIAAVLLVAAPLPAAGAPLALVVVIAVLGQGLGFHGVTALGAHRELRRSASARSRRAATSRTVALLTAGFGPAELVGALLVRPLLVAAAVLTVGGASALVAGTIAADLLIALASPWTRRLGGRTSRGHH